MLNMISRSSLGFVRPLRTIGVGRLILPTVTTRSKRYEAFDAHLDKDALVETRAWFSDFEASQLPKGSTTFARSSGPGGQHVNKYGDARPCSKSCANGSRTETKAITVYPVWELLSILPKTLHPFVRPSRYYTANNDSLTFHAQASRSRTANQEDNRRKLADEITRIYHENTPNETSEEKKKKYEEV